MMSALLDLHFPNRFISAEDVVIPTTTMYVSFKHAVQRGPENVADRTHAAFTLLRAQNSAM